MKTAVEFHDDFKTILMKAYTVDKKITEVAVKYGIILPQDHQDNKQNKHTKDSQQEQSENFKANEEENSGEGILAQQKQSENVELYGKVKLTDVSVLESEVESDGETTEISPSRSSLMDEKFESIARKYGLDSPQKHGDISNQDSGKQTSSEDVIIQQKQHKNTDNHEKEENTVNETKISPPNSWTMDENIEKIAKEFGLDLSQEYGDISNQDIENETSSKDVITQQKQHKNIDIHEDEENTVDETERSSFTSTSSSPQSLENVYKLAE